MKEIEVCAAVIIKDRKFLLTQRGYGEYKDKWEFPGGKIEKDESKEDAIKREIKEELDASIKVDNFLCKVEYNYTAFYLKMNVFCVSLENEHIIFKEHESYKWISFDDLDDVKKLDLLPADNLVISYLKKYIEKLTM